MLGKQYKYKGYDLGDLNGKFKGFALQNVSKDAAIRGNSFSFSNSFGSVNGPRIAESRVYDFTGELHIIDPAIREIRWAELCNVLKIESDFAAEKYHDLTWKTKDGKNRTTKAMVYEPLQASNDLCNPIVPFNFQLVSPDPRVYDPVKITKVWGLAQAWGTTLAFTIPKPFWDKAGVGAGGIACPNSGNWDAPCKITVEGLVVNPKIYIINNGQIKYFLEIDKPTTNLVIDNTNTVAEKSDSRFVITDNGQNIKAFRKRGGGGPLFIPGNNSHNLGAEVSEILVLADNYVDARNYTTVTVEYRNTFSY